MQPKAATGKKVATGAPVTVAEPPPKAKGKAAPVMSKGPPTMGKKAPPVMSKKI